MLHFTFPQRARKYIYHQSTKFSQFAFGNDTVIKGLSSHGDAVGAHLRVATSVAVISLPPCITLLGCCHSAFVISLPQCRATLPWEGNKNPVYEKLVMGGIRNQPPSTLSMLFTLAKITFIFQGQFSTLRGGVFLKAGDWCHCPL